MTMEKQGFNPYMPSWEYVPDGEPHVFGDRVYVYGSHDRFNGYAFCMNDYICYSAPVTDLKDWRYEGVIYKKTDSPQNEDGEYCMGAPDVCQGSDGRYYLYYSIGNFNRVPVAVCDTPAGRYQFLGFVHYEDGVFLGDKPGDTTFDPGVLAEGDKVYLYAGICPPEVKSLPGAKVTVLKADMLTIAEDPRLIVPSKAYSEGTGYEGHEFFEASSIRKVGDTYYYVYSSIWMHELCYATSSSPVEGFVFGGTIVSNVDLGIGTYKDSDRRMNYSINNHGGMAQINGQWYIFYHRPTNGHSFSRQGCIEPIEILPDGRIPQVEVTSCGPNGGPLKGEGYYPGYLACNLYSKDESIQGVTPFGKYLDPRFPYITQDEPDGTECQGYVCYLEEGSAAGYKYFDCKNTHLVQIQTRGICDGHVLVKTAPDSCYIGKIPVKGSNEWKNYPTDIAIPDGVQALYFEYQGYGFVSFNGFTLESNDL